MDYKEKYEMALEKAEGIIKYYKERNRNEAAIEDLQEIFPELKELRKIESQQAEIQKWSEEDEDNLTDTCVAIRKFYHRNNGAQDLIDWLQSLKERMKGMNE